ncbi:HD-GYP domain-containing protein [Paramaledivibacter caminithermalis]|jgi:HD-GYP domain-containing protein (c-di-GMP phosphodiesterase class II)|uniref:HD domain-containing protein n=1 Tax=Paramaledivibacter caminithermalis (strain DSM 15212 / CIP 107654 / DViRD3) TaxID=1121301 RepID=A0A1M6R258_PARC5|nr:HD domain-containing phosphohydrolase [Paramaledivibacter caminithermalis]SHK26581.1 HD domain-containing protein [Paramaledivibacter caminithermalis DSM 15212]
MEEKIVPEIDMILALSESLDLISSAIVGHHIRVALIALNVGLKFNMKKRDIKDLVYAALLHDVGALSLKDRIDGLEFDLKDPHFHSLIGYNLIKTYEPFSKISEIIRCHHVKWTEIDKFKDRGIEVSLSSQIIHLVDRVDVLMDWNNNTNKQIDYIVKQIKDQKGKKFNTEVVDAFIEISASKSIWEYMDYGNILRIFYKTIENELLDIEGFCRISKIFERIIDFRSRFTATHSSGVAYVASKLSEISGMTKKEVKMMRIAGNLHDLGKLAVPKELLEKPGRLSRNEFEIVKRHVYYTYSILKKIRGIGDIYEWAGFHHERINGKGYPFNKRAEELSVGARIMAVADVFTAISEDRPYRKGLKKEKVFDILDGMAVRNELDGDIWSILKSNYDEINMGRKDIQSKAVKEFKGFWDEINVVYGEF